MDPETSLPFNLSLVDPSAFSQNSGPHVVHLSRLQDLPGLSPLKTPCIVSVYHGMSIDYYSSGACPFLLPCLLIQHMSAPRLPSGSGSGSGSPSIPSGPADHMTCQRHHRPPGRPCIHHSGPLKGHKTGRPCCGLPILTSFSLMTSC